LSRSASVEPGCRGSWSRWNCSRIQALENAKVSCRAGSTLALRLNLPPSYLLIHRVWIGSIGVLCQLEAELPFRAILTEALPGFAGD
jgi:hypothetical protein